MVYKLLEGQQRQHTAPKVYTVSAILGRHLQAAWMSYAASVASAPPSEWPAQLVQGLGRAISRCVVCHR